MKLTKILSLAAALLISGACRAQGGSRESRPPRVAGSFYPADPSELRAMLDRFLAEAPRFECVNRPIALICPHAGYVYSGICAGRAYATLRYASGGKGVIKRVIVMGPSHYVPLKGVALPGYRYFQTPLGAVPVAVDIVEKLKSKPLFSVPEGTLGPEHSVEVQIPFLQRVLGKFTLLPLVVGSLRDGQFETVAEALSPFVDEHTLVVASSDFTHFGYRFDFVPFRSGIRRRIKELDFGALKRILAVDRKGFTEYISRTGATICGRHPIGILLALLEKRGGSRGVLLSYMSSGDRTGALSDAWILRQGSVSYAAVAFVRGGPAKVKVEPLDLLPHDKPLSKETRSFLLKLARSTIQRYLAGQRYRDPSGYVDPSELPEETKYRAGAFVTLKKGNMLRGCIGSIYPSQPLWEAVVSNAINAAVNDPRFPPMRPEELKEVWIEISVLTPPREIQGPEAFQVGRHGIILEKNGRRAVFLPQVAPEQGWGREETLDHLSLKAGLPRDAWREGARFWVFEAQVFGEKKH